jgi:hypothetical protein
MQAALDYYFCDILFVHRDTEKQSLEDRTQEIINAWNSTINVNHKTVMIPVTPVRMTKAWRLFDEQSIKTAAGNPNFSGTSSLPSLQRIEKLSNPKADLHKLIKQTSNLQKRELAKLKIPQRVHLIADNITDFSPSANYLPSKN